MGKRKTSFGSIDGNTITISDSNAFQKHLEGATGKLKEANEERQYIINDAVIKDHLCNYTFEITKGIGAGDKHSVKGSGVIEDDLRHAFGKFNVHLAVIDDVFKHSNIEITDIEEFETHDLTSLYVVTGFKIKGSKENESIILLGKKFVNSAGGRIELESPKIPLDNLSSYPWYQQLKEAADNARFKVALYKEGKYVPVETDEEEDHSHPTQLRISDNIQHDNDADFEDARL